MCSYSLCSECLQRIQIWRGDREIDPSTRREGRESWYLEIIDLNMVTITPLSPQLGQWEHISFVFSLSNQQLLIEKSWSRSWSIRGPENIRYWATQSRICVPSLGWQNYNFVLNFVQIVIVQISLQSAGGPGHRVLATQGAERLW